MASPWNQDLDSDTDSDTDILPTIKPPGVDPTYATCIHHLKWKLYQTIVLGPEPNTPEAQQNELLQKYTRTLESLYHILEKALRGSIADTEVRVFPSVLRHKILTCAMDLKRTRNAQHVADRVPYQDFLKQTLRMYPFVHRHVGGADQAVEDL
jgi:hypothetical protein